MRFCVQRPQQRSHDTRNITRVTKILFLCSQLVTQLLGDHRFFVLRAGSSVARTLKHTLIPYIAPVVLVHNQTAGYSSYF